MFPGTIILNPNINYTANAKPNFNVTSITTNNTDIFFGTPYYDLSWVGHRINANITGFSEGNNFSALITSAGTSSVTMNVLGQLQQVKLGGTNQPFGSTWTYATCRGLPCTQINVGSSTNIFLSWIPAVTQTSGFTASGYILANNGVFNNPGITLINPVKANVTGLLLWNTNGNLVSFQLLSTPFTLTANVPTTIPISLQDNTGPTGTQTYYEQAIIQTSTAVTVVTSNFVTLTYGTFTNGNLNFNVTNTNTSPIYFIKTTDNTTDTRLNVIYTNSMIMKCNLAYTFAFTNQTYGPPLSFTAFSPTQDNSSFLFHKVQNEIVTVKCTDTKSNQSANYVITQTSFPFQQQIANFRNGTYGTQGQFGAFDLVTLDVVILSMIGFNRKNEAVGAFFSITIMSIAAFFQIITIPSFILGAVIVVGMLAYFSTRKQAEVF